MSFLIIYMSHHGTTRKVTGMLAKKLGAVNTTVIDLNKDKAPDINKYDTVLIGGSIHVGQIQKKVRQFCEQNSDQLLHKRLGLFLCFMNRGDGKQEFEAAFPENLRNHAIAQGMFGGELLFENMNFFERFMTRKMSGHKSSVSQLDYDAIDRFVESMK